MVHQARYASQWFYRDFKNQLVPGWNKVILKDSAATAGSAGKANYSAITRVDIGTNSFTPAGVHPEAKGSVFDIKIISTTQTEGFKVVETQPLVKEVLVKEKTAVQNFGLNRMMVAENIDISTAEFGFGGTLRENLTLEFWMYAENPLNVGGNFNISVLDANLNNVPNIDWTNAYDSWFALDEATGQTALKTGWNKVSINLNYSSQKLGQIETKTKFSLAIANNQFADQLYFRDIKFVSKSSQTNFFVIEETKSGFDDSDVAMVSSNKDDWNGAWQNWSAVAKETMSQNKVPAGLDGVCQPLYTFGGHNLTQFFVKDSNFGIDTSLITSGKRALSMWFYITDPSLLDDKASIFITSYNNAQVGNYANWLFKDFKDQLVPGWNKIILKTSAAIVGPAGAPDYSNISYFSVSTETYIDGQLHTEIKGAVYDLKFIYTEQPDAIRVVERQEIPTDTVVPFVSPIKSDWNGAWQNWDSVAKATTKPEVVPAGLDGVCQPLYTFGGHNLTQYFVKDDGKGVDTSVFTTNQRALSMWFYITDPSLLDDKASIFITSYSSAQVENYAKWLIKDFKDQLVPGWNKIILKTSAATGGLGGAPDYSNISYFSVSTETYIDGQLHAEIKGAVYDIKFISTTQTEPIKVVEAQEIQLGVDIPFVSPDKSNWNGAWQNWDLVAKPTMTPDMVPTGFSGISQPLYSFNGRNIIQYFVKDEGKGVDTSSITYDKRALSLWLYITDPSMLDDKASIFIAAGTALQDGNSASWLFKDFKDQLIPGWNKIILKVSSAIIGTSGLPDYSKISYIMIGTDSYIDGQMHSEIKSAVYDIKFVSTMQVQGVKVVQTQQMKPIIGVSEVPFMSFDKNSWNGSWQENWFNAATETTARLFAPANMEGNSMPLYSFGGGINLIQYFVKHKGYGIDTTVIPAQKRALTFWLFITNPKLLDDKASILITSGTAAQDGNSASWLFKDFKNRLIPGWNKISLKTSNAILGVNGAPDYGNINYFSVSTDTFSDGQIHPEIQGAVYDVRFTVSNQIETANIKVTSSASSNPLSGDREFFSIFVTIVLLALSMGILIFMKLRKNYRS